MKSVGIDIVSIRRIKKIYDKYGEKFLNKILSEKEISFFKKKSDKRLIERISGIFAVKEAVIKCFNEKVYFKDISISYEKSGKPRCFVKNKEISISISHEKDYTIAIALLE